MKIKSLAVLATSALVLSGCATTVEEVEAEPQPSGVISIVATTNVWASVAEYIGGDQVNVVSIIDDVSQDPHSYESTPRDQLAVNDAELVLINGGGYDGFMEGLVEAADSKLVVLRAVDGENSHDHDDDHSDEEHSDEEHSDEEHSDEEHSEDEHSEEEHSEDEHGHGANEHVWYDIHVVEDVADALFIELSKLRPEFSGVFSENLSEFEGEMETLEVRLEGLRERALGSSLVATTPVADIFLEEAGFENLTPKDLTEAIEEERDVSPAALLAMTDLLESGEISVFITNDQVIDNQTESLTALAEQNGIPVIGFGELIPDADMDYLDWMNFNIDRLQEAIY